MTFTVQLDGDVALGIEDYARNSGKSTAAIVREAVADFLQNMRDVWDAEREIDEIRAGRSKTSPLKDVMREYGLAS
jgi:RHH-type transcriptional regulator, rel operon repressor / antitoxin RelB